MNPADISIFIGTPHYGSVPAQTLGNTTLASQRPMRIHAEGRLSSLITRNCNGLWCNALNYRQEKKLTHFVMLHSDIQPENYWLDKLLDEHEQCGADVLSVVVPIKDGSGDLSTAVFNKETLHCNRVSIQQLAKLPTTFGIADLGDSTNRTLLVNTGLFICNFDKPWVEEIVKVGRAPFCFTDEIVKLPNERFEERNMPEDWNFSIVCQAMGLKVMATRVVKVTHYGPHGWSNQPKEEPCTPSVT